MNLDDINNFIKVSECLNVTRASEALGITQPTLSYSLKRLERELDNKLLIRLKNGVELTKFGDQFLEEAHKLVNQWEQLKKMSGQKDQELSGQYTIGCHPSVGLYSLDKFLPKLISDNKNLNVNIHTDLSRVILEQVISFKIDFGLVINPIKHPDLVMKKIYDDKVTFFKTKESKNTLIYDDNLKQTLAILKKTNYSKYQIENTIKCENLEIIAKLTSEGLGIGILPERVASKYKNLEKMKGAPIFNDELYLVYRAEKHQNEVSKKFVDYFKLIK